MNNRRLPMTWSRFGEEVFVNRIWKSKNNPIIVLYLAIVVGFVGSSGVWLPLMMADTTDCCFKLDETLSVGLATYCIALLAATMADHLLSKSERSKTVRFFTFCIFALSYTTAFVTIYINSPLIGGVTTLLTYLVWVTTYSMDPAKRDSMRDDQQNPTGGDTSKVELQGTTAGFQVNS